MSTGQMPNVRLYIAVSLDGFIADAEGGVDWLSETSSSETNEDYGYAEFYDSVGSLVMGRKTYEQILGFGDWPYPGKPAYVFTHTDPEGRHPNVEFVSEDPETFVRRTGLESGEDLWLVGGAGLIASFRKQELIDEYLLTVMPILLGEGIRLFESHRSKKLLEFTEIRSYDSGAVQLRYDTR